MISSFENKATFSFTCVTVDDISKEIKRLDVKKTNPAIFKRIFFSFELNF